MPPGCSRAAAAEGWGEDDDDVAEDEDWDNWGDEDKKAPKQERRATKERVQHYRKQIKVGRNGATWPAVCCNERWLRLPFLTFSVMGQDYILDLADPFVLKEVDSRLRARTYEVGPLPA